MTLEDLAAQVDALQQRVALLELRCGFATDNTVTDLPVEVAAATLGTNPANLEYYSQAAKEARAAERAQGGAGLS